MEDLGTVKFIQNIDEPNFSMKIGYYVFTVLMIKGLISRNATQI